MYTWNYENRAGKPNFFVTFHSFSCLILAWYMCYLRLMSFSFFFLFAAFWLGICVEVDVDISTTPPPPRPVLMFLPLPTILLKWHLFEISARLKLVSVQLSSLLLDIGHLEKSFPESIT